MSKNAEIINRNTMENVSAVAGAGLGVGAASAIGTVVGGAGILGTIGSAFGLTVATATPVGWLIGGALIGGAALKYGSKAIGIKGKSDGTNQTLENKVAEEQSKRLREIGTRISQADINTAKSLWMDVLDKNSEYFQTVKDILKGLDKGATSPNEAIELACGVLSLNVSDYLNDNQVSIDELNLITALSVVMMAANGEFKPDEENIFFQTLHDFYGVNEDDTKELLSYALDNYNKLIKMTDGDIDERIIFLTAAECFNSNTHLHKQVLNILEAIGSADGDFDEDERAIYNFAERAFEMAAELDQYSNKIANLPTNDSDFFLPNHKKFPKKLGNAIQAYARNLPLKQVIGLYDSTIFGKGDEGFLLTPLSIITDQEEIIFYNEVTRATISDELGNLILHLPNEEVELPVLEVDDGEIFKYFNQFKK